MKWFWLSGVIIVLDQCTKLLAEARLSLHNPVEVMPYFALRKAYNTGAAFSLFHDGSGWQRWFFIALAVLVIGVLVVWLRQIAANQARTALALALILGGAAGNLIDRVVYGHVIDFIDVYYGSWHWPTFNIADSAITVGACLLVLDALLTRKQQPSS
ncbi:MAG: signal peptidase II [Gammaproteobacteria bacterium]|nr:signal peptidase II [Gammaproteobacteria bacterium]